MEQHILDTLRYDGGMTAIFRKIGCIGDSLSSGEFEHDQKGIKGFWDCYDYSWGKFMERTLGNQVTIFAKGGLTAYHLYKDADEGTSTVQEINHLFDPQYLQQAYIIALGVNDLVGEGALEKLYGGEIGDPQKDICLTDYQKNAGSFVGVYAKIILRLQQMQPDAKFFLVSMPNDQEENFAPRCPVHLKVLKEMAQVLPNCYVIDLYHHAPPYDAAFREKYFIGGHMNAMGYRQTSYYIMTYINWIIENQPKDFAAVSYIGSPYHPVTPFTRREKQLHKIVNGELNEFYQWLDEDGNIINASDGGMIYVDGRYYWYGQKLRPLPFSPKGKGGQVTTTGVVMYSSADLYRWRYEGVILACSDDPSSPLYAPMRFERPKILYNAKTKQFVLWCHYVRYPGDHGDQPGTAEAGVAVCDRVNGCYRFLGTSRPIDDVGLVRDSTLYQDIDGSAYFIYDRVVKQDRCLYLVKLREDYLAFTDEYTRIDVACYREAAALVQKDGYYYMITSDLTSWKHNQARYFRAKNLFGPWECMGSPCTNDTTCTTFESQSTYIFRVESTDLYIHMAERHNTDNFERCSYIWLPIQFGEDHTLHLTYQKEWTLEQYLDSEQASTDQ